MGEIKSGENIQRMINDLLVKFNCKSRQDRIRMLSKFRRILVLCIADIDNDIVKLLLNE